MPARSGKVTTPSNGTCPTRAAPEIRSTFSAISKSSALAAKSRPGTKTDERTGTIIEFTPDEKLFGSDFKFRTEFIEDMLWNYAFLNRGLTLTLNGKAFRSEHGLKDLLQKNLSGEPLYPIVHLEGEDIEVMEMPFEEMRRMVQDGRIVDAKTVLLSLFLERELGLPPL